VGRSSGETDRGLTVSRMDTHQCAAHTYSAARLTTIAISVCLSLSASVCTCLPPAAVIILVLIVVAVTYFIQSHGYAARYSVQDQYRPTHFHIELYFAIKW